MAAFTCITASFTAIRKEKLSTVCICAVCHNLSIKETQDHFNQQISFSTSPSTSVKPFKMCLSSHGILALCNWCWKSSAMTFLFRALPWGYWRVIFWPFLKHSPPTVSLVNKFPTLALVCISPNQLLYNSQTNPNHFMLPRCQGSQLMINLLALTFSFSNCKSLFLRVLNYRTCYGYPAGSHSSKMMKMIMTITIVYHNQV